MINMYFYLVHLLNHSFYLFGFFFTLKFKLILRLPSRLPIAFSSIYVSIKNILSATALYMIRNENLPQIK